MLTFILYLTKVIATLTLLFNASVTTANQYSAHIHGHAELTIAIDKNIIDLKLITPAENLLGFEHKATSAADISTVVTMKKHLSQYANVIVFNNAECDIENSNVDTGNILTYGHKDHTNEHENIHSHTEITVDYKFHCAKTDDISSASIKLFDHYSGIKIIDVMWLTTNQQGSIKLDMKNTGVNFQ
jgi:hypothetical protein